MLDGRLGKKITKIKTTEVHRKAAATGAWPLGSGSIAVKVRRGMVDRRATLLPNSMQSKELFEEIGDPRLRTITD